MAAICISDLHHYHLVTEFVLLSNITERQLGQRCNRNCERFTSTANLRAIRLNVRRRTCGPAIGASPPFRESSPQWQWIASACRRVNWLRSRTSACSCALITLLALQTLSSSSFAARSAAIHSGPSCIVHCILYLTLYLFAHFSVLV